MKHGWSTEDAAFWKSHAELIATGPGWPGWQGWLFNGCSPAGVGFLNSFFILF